MSEVSVNLSERDVQALRFAVDVIRGIESQFAGNPMLGIREGEATSDVLAAVVARADIAKAGS